MSAEQGTLFGPTPVVEPDTGEKRKRRGLRRAAATAPPGWMDRAMRAIAVAAGERALFTTDDVWATGLDRPPNGRALGAAMVASMKAGLIEPTGTFQPTRQTSRNRAPVRLWRSLARRSAR